MWLRSLLAGGEPGSAPRGPDDDFWYTSSPGAARSSAGMVVSPDTALTIGAVYRAVNLIANDIAALPLHLVRRLPEREGGRPGGKVRVRNSLDRLLSGKRVNPTQTPFQWRSMAMTHVLLRGDHYSLVRPGASGAFGELKPLHPARTRAVFLDNGRELVLHRNRAGREVRYTQDEVTHLRGFNPDPDDPCGLSVVGLARTAMGLTLATEEFGARQFSQAPRPSFIITLPGKLEPADRRDFEDSFRRQWSGTTGWGGTPVLQNGAKAEQVGMSHEDAQFLETRNFQIAEVARWFGVPLHLLNELSRATFSNIEEQQLAYVMHAILTWVVMFEQCIERDLVLEDDVEAEFVLDGLLRGDSLKRAQAYQIHANMKALTPNEIRALEGRNPVPWGDEPLQTQGAAPAPPSEPPPARPKRDGKDDDQDAEDEGDDAAHALDPTARGPLALALAAANGLDRRNRRA